MDAGLQAPPSRVSLTEGHTTDQESVVWDTTIARDDGEKLFSVEGPGVYSSMTLRRHLKDASGRPVFDLRRKIGWLVEDARGNKITELSYKKFFTSSGALVEIRPRDIIGITKYVNISNATITEISVHSNNIKKGLMRDRDISVFRVRVVFMALIRAEMAHVWQK
ncbi:hypothetical protein N7471_010124 [Penicillium samsonianum]|uniref:uncharacterized protein n=1 Tax=Penicillium samsonianum TaxID=1882272 RepID=UPI002547E0A6|nr:uncharacterized protein N7471_010124 [Penicillium samsonianum]KAJ6128907.1 hypothetical protein N7471_010124 [Penicillium samsonianum]